GPGSGGRRRLAPRPSGGTPRLAARLPSGRDGDPAVGAPVAGHAGQGRRARAVPRPPRCTGHGSDAGSRLRSVSAGLPLLAHGSDQRGAPSGGAGGTGQDPGRLAEFHVRCSGARPHPRCRGPYHLLKRREEARAAWRRFFQEFDVLVGPTTLDAAFPHQVGSFEMRTLLVDKERVPYYSNIIYPMWAIFAGQPATAFPAGLNRQGLPLGLQAIGPYLEDRTPLRF